MAENELPEPDDQDLPVADPGALPPDEAQGEPAAATEADQLAEEVRE